MTNISLVYENATHRADALLAAGITPGSDAVFSGELQLRYDAIQEQSALAEQYKSLSALL